MQPDRNRKQLNFVAIVVFLVINGQEKLHPGPSER